MINVFFLEFKEDLHCFLKYWDKTGLIVALRPEVALELEIMGISYQQLQVDYYTQAEYEEFSSQCMSELSKTIYALDEKLARFNDRVKEIKIDPFQLYTYYFKLPLDSIRIKIFELDHFFAKQRVNCVKMIVHSKRDGADQMYYFEDESIYSKLLPLMQNKYNYSLQALEGERDVETDLARFNCFEPGPHKSIIKQIAGYFKKQYIQKVRFLGISWRNSSTLNRKGRILSVNCRELEDIRNELISLGWAIYHFPESRSIHSKHFIGDNWDNGFIDNLLSDEIVMNRFRLLGIDYFGLIKDRLSYFCKNIGFVINSYFNLSKYLDKHNYDVVFFSTHAPHEIENALLPLICKARGIPYVCWMHGGYGANLTVAGFDVSDYKYGDHYFVYGEEVKRLIDNHYPQYNLSTYVAGSPMLKKRYQNYVPPKNNRRVITLVLPSWCTNRLHVDTLNPYYNYSYWIPIKAILEVLIEYSDRYRIIVRAGSNKFKSQIETIGKFLKHHGAENVEIIPIEEMTFTNVAGLTDLFINLWVSTTFWEECLTKADIFLMDNSDLTDTAKKIVPSRAFWHSDLTIFVAALREYLDKGTFYQKSDNSTFLKSYLDYERKEHIAENASALVEKIIQTGSRK